MIGDHEDEFEVTEGMRIIKALEEIGDQLDEMNTHFHNFVEIFEHFSKSPKFD